MFTETFLLSCVSGAACYLDTVEISSAEVEPPLTC